MNLRDQTIAGLLATGAAEVIPSPTSKYRTFRDHSRNDAYFFVGRSGALRYGETITGSRSLTNSRQHRAYRSIGNPECKWESAEQARAAYDRIASYCPCPAVSGYVDTQP